MSESPVLEGAEAWSADGGPAGLLLLHGFTGNPSSFRAIGEAAAAAGFAVEVPRLPGHGTAIEDMVPTRFADWAAEADAAYHRLADRTDRVVVVGQSMGGTLACWLAARHPEIAGLVGINPAVLAPDPQVFELFTLILEAGEEISPGVGSDVADPDVAESAYDGSPVAAAGSLLEAVVELQDELPKISCPVLIVTSRQDHVVAPEASDLLASVVAGPVERVYLERSYHVATLDYDKELVTERTIEFARKVTAS
jgi:carboxylesterase